MITGIGIDMVSIARVTEIYQRHGQAFADKILSESELRDYAQIENKEVLHVPFLAKRFAVKEAAAKALGTGLRNGVTLKDFSLSHNKMGKPELVLAGQAAIQLASWGSTFSHVSISDEKDHAIAMVVFEAKE